jgi:hypothetical protein
MAKWDGHERRQWERRSGCQNGVCMLHDTTHEGVSSRIGTVCGKVKQLKQEHDADILRVDGEIEKVESKIEAVSVRVVGWKTVSLLSTIMIGLVGGIFLYMHVSFRDVNTDINRIQKGISTLLSEHHLRVD